MPCSLSRGSPSLRRRWLARLALLLILSLWLVAQARPSNVVQAALSDIAGHVYDEHGQPVPRVEIAAFLNGESVPAAQTVSQSDGAYVVTLPRDLAIHALRLEFYRSHFYSETWTARSADLNDLQQHGGLVLDDIVLRRRLTLGFWAASAIFIGMLYFIATERLHNTTAALLAAAVLFAVTFVGGAVHPDLFIFDFERAIEYVDFEVIFLLLGMMIVIGIIEETGIFQWLAFQSYRLSQGKAWMLAVILMVMAALTSSLLDNVITLLLIAPITLEIALAMGLDPLSLLIPEILSANVGGIATLIGTPTNIVIGSYAGLGFSDFLSDLAPGVILAQVGLILLSLVWYRKEYRKQTEEPPAMLHARLEERARIEDPRKLRKAGIVFAGLLLLFIFGERIHLTPAVSAMIGAVTMLIWVHPDIDQMMSVVDWTTLMFFIGLFMVVGAIIEVGLIALIASSIGDLAGGSAIAALAWVVGVAALGSGLVENIPLAAAMLPVVDYLLRTIPGANHRLLYYGLAIGTGMGGNSSLIGASPNLVTAGIAERAGYPIRFKTFLAIGLPATVLTVILGCIWLLLRF